MEDAENAVGAAKGDDAMLMPPPPPRPKATQAPSGLVFDRLSVEQLMEPRKLPQPPTPPKSAAPRRFPPTTSVFDQPDMENILILFGGFDEFDKSAKVCRHRYWTSWEEVRLIELWRRYRDEVVTLDKSTPVFRKIFDGMRDSGIHVNSQECRRKINSLKNRYIRERQMLMMKPEPGATSKWPPYALINSLVTNHSEHQKLNHQEEVVNEFFSRIPIRHDDDEPFISRKQYECFMQHSALFRQLCEMQNFKFEKKTEPPKHVPQSAPQKHVLQSEQKPPNVADGFSIRSTMPTLEELREDNRRLVVERDAGLKKLRLQTRENECVAEAMKQFLKQQEDLLRLLNEGDELANKNGACGGQVG